MRSRELPIPGFRSVGCPFPRLPPSASSFSREEIGKSSYGYPFLENEEDTSVLGPEFELHGWKLLRPNFQSVKLLRTTPVARPGSWFL